MIIVGTALLIAALALFMNNEQESSQAGKASSEAMPQVVSEIYDRHQDALEQTPAKESDGSSSVLENKKMSVVLVEGYGYIGFVGIPSLGLELPVMDKWDMERLKLSPCRYWGDMYTGDLVVMAHNYNSHFGKLSQLKAGDSVTFTDMDGFTANYEVVAVEILDAMASREMTSGEFDLTLFTCTFGGENRVTVRCDRT